jgi:hypothetical protein
VFRLSRQRQSRLSHVTGGVVPVLVSPVPGVGGDPGGVRDGLAAVAPGAPAGVQPGVGVLSSASQGPAPGVVPDVVPGNGLHAASDGVVSASQGPCCGRPISAQPGVGVLSSASHGPAAP